jgi:hypothetical protein
MYEYCVQSNRGDVVDDDDDDNDEESRNKRTEKCVKKFKEDVAPIVWCLFAKISSEEFQFFKAQCCELNSNSFKSIFTLIEYLIIYRSICQADKRANITQFIITPIAK